MELDRPAFEALVSDVLDEVPAEMLAVADNLVVTIEDEPRPEHLDGDDQEAGELLGVYLGTPLTERDSGGVPGGLPDQVVLFRGPLTRMCVDEAQLREEIYVTIVHEVAHHVGISEERLHALGWG